MSILCHLLHNACLSSTTSSTVQVYPLPLVPQCMSVLYPLFLKASLSSTTCSCPTITFPNIGPCLSFTTCPQQFAVKKLLDCFITNEGSIGMCTGVQNQKWGPSEKVHNILSHVNTVISMSVNHTTHRFDVTSVL